MGKQLDAALDRWEECVDALERNALELNKLEMAYAIAQLTVELAQAEESGDEDRETDGRRARGFDGR